MEDGHTKTVEEVVNYFNTDPERGLTPDQVKKYQEKYGPNGKSFIFTFIDLLFFMKEGKILRMCCAFQHCYK